MENNLLRKIVLNSFLTISVGVGVFAVATTTFAAPGDTFDNQTGPNLTLPEAPTTSVVTDQSEQEAGTTPFIQPQLIVPPLPDFSFSEIKVTNSEEEILPDGTSVFTRTATIPFLADYLAAIYKYAVAVGGILATVLMMLGGFQYLVGQPKEGLARIKNATTGLLITFVSYVILQSVNTALVSSGGLGVTLVKAVPFEDQLLDEFGSASDFDTDNVSSLELPEVLDGEFRKKMNEACGAKDGESLPTYQAKIERLRTIVATWQKIGGDDGGAIYIRGGAANCAYSNPQPDYMLKQLSRVTKYLSAELSADCRNAVLEAGKPPENPDGSKLKKGDIKNWVVQIALNHGMLDNSPPNEPPKKPKILLQAKCTIELNREYDRIFMQAAQKAGLLCGDCKSYQGHIYNCWSKKAGDLAVQNHSLSRTASNCTLPTGPSTFVPECILTKKNYKGTAAQVAAQVAAAVDKCISSMRFGDLMSSQNHVWMYTGKAGLPYEIVEMGGGGAGDIVCEDKNCGGKLASKNAGLPEGISLSGVRASVDAQEFLLKHHKNDACIRAWRPIQP